MAHLPVKVIGSPKALALAASLACICAALPRAVLAAEGFTYSVRVSAPDPLDDLLRDNLDLLRFRNSPRMDREQLQRMVRAAPEQVKTLVATAGYYSPRVSARIIGEGAEPVVEVDVEPGQPVRVSTVDVELQGFASSGGAPFDQEALKASWALPKGEVFRQDAWEQAKRGLLRSVVQTRYPRAQYTDTQATVDPDNYTAALRVALDSGPELRFGDLRIEGLKRYPESLVRNLNQIKPGDYYDEAALQAYQSRLQDTGYFMSVDVSADISAVIGEQMEAAAEKQTGAPLSTDPRAMAPLPLLVRVVENKRRNVSAGLGYSTNTGKRVSLNYDDLAVFGLKMKSALTLETKKQTARADFYLPTSDDGYNHSFGTAFERSDIEGEQTTVFTVYGKRAWGTPLLERSLSVELLTEQKTVAGVPDVRATSLPLTYAVTRRKVDNLLFPSRGHVLNWQIGGAVLPLLTDEPFIRIAAKGIKYLPLDAKQTVILRVEAGALASRKKEGVPATYLFRAGGDGSVRGYAYHELGVDELGATVGGRYLATASAEYQYWFKPAWGAAVFYDAGNAGDVPGDLHPKSGYGVGARWKSPVGPINVDLAYGHAVKKARLHFSLGFTF